MMKTFRIATLGTLACLCFLAGGCGYQSEVERVVVSGTVTYQGKPIEVGVIRFCPVEGTKAPASGAPITDGSYKIDAKGGIPVGNFKIKIIAYSFGAVGTRKYGSGSDEDAGVPPRKQFLPKKYNDQTELTVTIEHGSGEFTKDFKLGQ